MPELMRFDRSTDKRTTVPAGAKTRRALLSMAEATGHPVHYIRGQLQVGGRIATGFYVYFQPPEDKGA